MKTKYYLRGFGTGILFATIILMIAFMLHDNKASNQKYKVNSSGNADALENTTEQNSTTEKESTKEDNGTAEEESTTGQHVTTEKENTDERNDTVGQENTDGQNDTVGQENTTSQENVPVDETTLPVDNEEYVTLNITSGMISNKAAALLEEYGVVESGYDFNMYLYNNGYESKLRVGTYQIKKGSSYEEIAKIITRK